MSDTLFLKLDTEEREYVTGAADPDDEWDRDDTRSEWDIKGLTLVTEKDGYDFLTRTKQDRYWVVVEFYDTGDSFSRHENCMAEIYLGHTREDAEYVAQEFVKATKAAKDDHSYRYSVTLPDPHTGEEMTLHLNSVGYFEHLVGVDVIELSVGSRRRFN